MYVDVETEKLEGKYRISIYREGKVERIASNNMNKIAEYIQKIKINNEQIYIDNRGFGLYLIDCLRQINESYSVLCYSYLDLEKIVGE